jgi:hypothetical protein
VELHVEGYALWAQRFDAMLCFADVGDWVLVMIGAGCRDGVNVIEERSLGFGTVVLGVL